MTAHSCEDALAVALSALSLIASPMRPDGTYNRDRAACGQLARDTLARIDDLLASPQAKPPVTANDEPFMLTSPVAAVGAGQKLVLYTDGGCSGNPGPAGWGAVLVRDGVVLAENSGFIGTATNQIAELVAAIEGLKATPEGAEIELVSDSQYTLKGLSEWRKGWERNGWKNASGQPVANQSYWKALYALADKRKVKTRWVKGHNGDPFNEKCDELARAAIKQAA